MESAWYIETLSAVCVTWAGWVTTVTSVSSDNWKYIIIIKFYGTLIIIYLFYVSDMKD